MPTREIKTIFAIDGEKKYSDAIKDINKEQKVLSAEMKASAAAFELNGNKQGKLKAEIDGLNKQLDLQKQKVAEAKNAVNQATKIYGENSAKTQELKIQYFNADAALSKLQGTIIKSNKDLEAQASKLKASGEAAQKAGEKLKKTGESVSNVGSKLTTGITTPVIAGAAALAALVIKTTETADKYQQLSDKTGLSTERLQELAYVGAKTDTELETMTGSQSKLIKAMSAAKDPTSAQGKAFKELGVSAVDANENLRDSNDVWGEVIDKLGQMPNETEADAIAMKLLGKSALDLNPLIKAGSAEIANLSAEAHKNGAIMSGESIEAMDKFSDSIAAAKLSISTAAGEITVKMLPTLNKLLPIVQKNIVPAIGEFAETVGDLIVGFDKMDPSTKALVTTLAGMVVVAGPLLKMAGTGITVFGTMKTALGAHKIAMAGAALATDGLAASEGTAAVAGAGLTAALGPVAIVAAALAATAIAYNILSAGANEATKAVTDVTDAMVASNKTFNESIDDTEASAASTKAMTDKLYNLEAQEKKSNAQKSQMKMLVASLNSSVSGLNLTYDEQTDSLNKNKDAVYELIDAKMAELKKSAYEDQIKQAYKDQITQTDLYTKALERYNKANAKITTIMNPIEAAKATAEFYASADALTAVSAAMDSTDASLKRAEDGYASLSDAADKSNTDVVEVTQETKDEVKAIYDARVADIEKMNADLEQSAKDHYSEMGSIDQDGIEKTKLTAAEIKKNLEQQIKDYQDWRASIKELAGKVPDDVLSELKSLGPEMAPVIEELNGMTDKDLESWIAVFEEKGTLAETTAREDAAAVAAALAGGTDNATEAGASLIGGFMSGMESKEEQLIATAKRIAAGVPLPSFSYKLPTTKSSIASLPGFAVGTKYLPKDMIIQAHKGELIVPESENPYANSNGSVLSSSSDAVISGDMQNELSKLSSAVRSMQITTSDLAAAGAKLPSGQSPSSGGSSKIEHSGEITVVGVNNQGETVGATKIIMDQLVLENMFSGN